MFDAVLFCSCSQLQIWVKSCSVKLQTMCISKQEAEPRHLSSTEGLPTFPGYSVPYIVLAL